MIDMKNIILFVFLLSQLIPAQSQTESDDFSYALKLYEERFYDLAAQQFIRYSNMYPNSTKRDEAGFYAGMSLYNAADYENAQIEFQSVGINFPKSKRAPESWFWSGKCFLKINKKSEAAKSFERVKTLYPGHSLAAESALKAGIIYKELDEPEKALQLYSLIQERYIDTSVYYKAILAHAQLLADKGDYGQAKVKLMKIIQSNTDGSIKSDAYFYLGETNFKQGYIQDALSYYQKVISEFEESHLFSQTILAVANIKIQENDYKYAQKILKKGLNSDPDEQENKKMNLLLADVYFLDQKYALAQNLYESYSSNIETIIKSALCMYNQNNTEQAIAVLENIISDEKYIKNTYFPWLKNMLFDWLSKEGMADRALSHYNKLKSISAIDENDRVTIIELLKEQGNYRFIANELEPVFVNQDKINEIDDYTFELAYAYEKLERFRESANLYQKIIDTFNSSKYVNDAQSRLNYLETYELINQDLGINKLALLLGDIINEGDKASLNFKLGKIYFEELKDFDSALKQFQYCKQIAEKDVPAAELNYYIGMVYRSKAESEGVSAEQRSNFYDQAKKYLTTAMGQVRDYAKADIIADKFVETGIIVEKSSNEKQINYYVSLVKNYPDSHLKEKWIHNLADLYSYQDSTIEKSLKLYTQLILNYPESQNYPRYLFRKAELQSLNNLNLSLDLYREIVNSYPTSKPAAAALFRLAEAYEINSQFKEAHQLYMMLVNNYYYTDYYKLVNEKIGDINLLSGQYNEAIQIYSEKLEKLPLNDIILREQFVEARVSAVFFKLGKAYYNKENWIKARENLNIYLTLSVQGNDRSEAYLLLGDVYSNLNQQKSAIESYVKIDQNDISAYRQGIFKAAELYFANGNYAESAALFEKFITISNNAEQNKYAFGQNIIANIREGRKSQAEKNIKQFVNSYKNVRNHLASFQFEFGNYYRQNKNYNDAIRFFKNILKKYRKSSYTDDAEYFLALTYITLNKNKDALEILTNFASKYPDSDRTAAVFNTLGGIYFRSEKYESAALTFKSALEKNPDDNLKKQIMSNLIRTYTFVNFWDAALALSREYIELYPEAQDIVDKKIIIAQAQVNLNQFERAIELLKQARIEADSEKEPEIQFYIGDTYLKAGQYENAIAEFVKIPLLSRKTKLQWEASALYYSGQAYEKMGRIDDAIRMYQEIVKRPGIDMVLKKDAQKRIEQIKS